MVDPSEKLTPGSDYWWSVWLHPAAVLVLLGVLGSAYAAVLLQRERIARLEARVAVVETQAARRDVVLVQLEAINQRLAVIERALDRRQEGR